MSKNKIFIIIATLILCFAGLNNKYPLLTDNSDTFIIAGFTRQLPSSGSFIYGLFVTYASWATSLWLVILYQSALVAILLFFYFKYLERSVNRLYYYLGFVFSSAIVLSGSLTVSTIDPGIFSALTILSIGAIILTPKLRRRDFYIVAFVLFLSVLMGNFNLLLGTLIVVTFIILLPFRKQLNYSLSRLAIVALIVVCGWLTASVVNQFKTGVFTPVAHYYAEVLPRLTTAGITKRYLELDEETDDTELYLIKDSLEQVFTDNSMYTQPSLTESQVREYSKISRTIFQFSEFKADFLTDVLLSFGKELLQVDTKKQLVLNDSIVVKALFDWYNEDVREEYTTRQLNNNMGIVYQDVAQQVILSFCLIWFIWLLYKKQLKEHLGLWVFMITGYVLHAFVSGLINGACHNQWHVAWLLLLPVFFTVSTLKIADRFRPKNSCITNSEKESTL